MRGWDRDTTRAGHSIARLALDLTMEILWLAAREKVDLMTLTIFRDYCAPELSAMARDDDVDEREHDVVMVGRWDT